MTADFTIKTYRELLLTLKSQGYSFITVSEFLTNTFNKVCILRHDVDRLPDKSLEFATIQQSESVKGTYYFRITSSSWNEGVIKRIHDLGHEIGYHYEDINIASKRLGKTKDFKNDEKMLVDAAIKSFTENLEKLRNLVPVETICMHGSPLSKWDSRLLWRYYNYRDYGIRVEPYFDIDFSNVFYLTDTGRRWDGDSFNIRDKVINAHAFSFPFSNLKIHSTFDIINAVKGGKLPDKILLTFHPQRWYNQPVPWLEELVCQNMKNVLKYALRKLRDN